MPAPDMKKGECNSLTKLNSTLLDAIGHSDFANAVRWDKCVLHKPSANQHVSGSGLRPFRSVDTSSWKIQDDVNQFPESVSDPPNNLRDIYSQLYTENSGPSSVRNPYPSRENTYNSDLGRKDMHGICNRRPRLPRSGPLS
jgi:hypothetical protein